MSQPLRFPAPARRLHFVGSLPPQIATDAEAAIRWFLTQAGELPLTAVPCDADPVRIIDYLVGLAKVRTEHGNPVFETAVPGTYRSYDTMGVYRLALDPIAKGVVTLRPEHVSMNRVDRTRSVIELFRGIRAENPNWAHLRHQISLPSPLDLALFVFTGPPFSPTKRLPKTLQALPKLGALLTALRHVPVFAEAARREVAELCATDASDIVFQIETPAVLIMLSMTPKPLRPLVTRLLARHLARFLASLPSTAATILHLCYGDLGHQPLMPPKDITIQVNFLNALADHLRATGTPLPEAHLPVAHGDHAPSTDPAFYVPLLRLDRDYSVIAGVAAENHPEASRDAFCHFETFADRGDLTVATACGLGRRDPSQAGKAVNLMHTLAHMLPRGATSKTTITGTLPQVSAD